MQYRDNLPQLEGKPFMTDGGLETTLIFLEGLDLPEFASIDLIRTERGRKALESYYRGYLELAKRCRHNFVLESPTWRSNPDWVEPLGYSMDEMDGYNRAAVLMMARLKAEYESRDMEIVISGCIGPRSDGYNPAMIMSADEARRYHAHQIGVFARVGVDCVTAITMGYPAEAIGIVLAAQDEKVPSIISFTVETDGRLVTGQNLKDAIETVDAETGHGPAYYMINCAHPSHFEKVLGDEAWVSRIRGIRANASRCSHAELDEAEELDIGNPDELARDYSRMTAAMPHINVVGGCCGTDIRHLEKIMEYRA